MILVLTAVHSSAGATEPCPPRVGLPAEVAYFERFGEEMVGIADRATDPRLTDLPEFNHSVSAGFRWLNRGAIRLMRREQAEGLSPSHWMAVVPGESEQWGHHCAPVPSDDPDGTALSCKFKQRLERAFDLLRSGQSRFLFLTGGWMSGGRGDYNEALRARRYLIEHYADEWARTHGGEDLWNRLVVDPQAQTTVDNIRNAAHFGTAMGVQDFLVVTEMPERAGLNQRRAREFAKQGFYLENCTMSTFNLRSMFAHNLDDAPGGECRRTDPIATSDGRTDSFIEFSGYYGDGALPIPFAFSEEDYDPWRKPAGFPNDVCSSRIGCSGCTRGTEDRSACGSPVPNP